MVVAGHGKVKNGWASTVTPLVGRWVRKELPVTYDATFAPAELVNRTVSIAGSRATGKITGVYSTDSRATSSWASRRFRSAAVRTRAWAARSSC